ncbi:hypothetical protein [Streptomyces sp. SP18CS02]|nr:hypothetical protein [Streptomyces sp. SP18CS02]MEE1751216.1 hypothetical protein [Streptomyces sp. SP18CS02]
MKMNSRQKGISVKVRQDRFEVSPSIPACMHPLMILIFDIDRKAH